MARYRRRYGWRPLYDRKAIGKRTQVLDDVTVAATGTVALSGSGGDRTGTLDITLDALTGTLVASNPAAATLAATLGGLAITAAGTNAIKAALAKTLDDLTISATGNRPVTLTATLEDVYTSRAFGGMPLLFKGFTNLAFGTVTTGTNIRGQLARTLEDL